MVREPFIFSPACGNIYEGEIWTGYSDHEQEGFFRNVLTGEPLENVMQNPWYYGEPNGNTLENCAVIWPYRKAWNDLSCGGLNGKACGFCEFETYPDFEIRGNI